MSMCIVVEYPGRTPEFFESLVKQIAPEGCRRALYGCRIVTRRVIGKCGIATGRAIFHDTSSQCDKSGAMKITKLQIHKHSAQVTSGTKTDDATRGLKV